MSPNAKLTIAHVVNPVAVPPSSDLHVAQPITFETMKGAREAAGPDLEISFFSAQFPEDRVIVPSEFEMTEDLENPNCSGICLSHTGKHR